MKNTNKIIASALLVASCSLAGVSSIFASTGSTMSGSTYGYGQIVTSSGGHAFYGYGYGQTGSTTGGSGGGAGYYLTGNTVGAYNYGYGYGQTGSTTGGGGGGFTIPTNATPNTGAIVGTGKTSQYYISKDKASIALYKGTVTQVTSSIDKLTKLIVENNKDTKLTENQKLSINARLNGLRIKLVNFINAIQ